MPWFKGPSLEEAMESLHEPPAFKKSIDKVPRMCVFGSIKVSGYGTVALGKMVQGQLKVDDVVCHYKSESRAAPPTNQITTLNSQVKSIEMHYK